MSLVFTENEITIHVLSRGQCSGCTSQRKAMMQPGSARLTGTSSRETLVQDVLHFLRRDYNTCLYLVVGFFTTGEKDFV